MAKKLAQFEINHNDIGDIERGPWRKYNPYNPYVEPDEKQPVNDLKVESLDDLFDDEDSKTENKEKASQKESNIDTLDIEDAPTLPIDSENDNSNEEEYNLQKELEAKFDELFGPLDDD